MRLSVVIHNIDQTAPVPDPVLVIEVLTTGKVEPLSLLVSEVAAAFELVSVEVAARSLISVRVIVFHDGEVGVLGVQRLRGQSKVVARSIKPDNGSRTQCVALEGWVAGN